jgi:hypothetical protein
MAHATAYSGVSESSDTAWAFAPLATSSFIASTCRPWHATCNTESPPSMRRALASAPASTSVRITPTWPVSVAAKRAARSEWSLGVPFKLDIIQSTTCCAFR